MCAAISRSEAVGDTQRPPPAPPPRWADGAGEIGIVHDGAEIRLGHLYQSDPCRILFPRPAARGPFEAVFVTTSGGLVGGDRLRLDISAGANSTSCVTSQAAEKVYRSAGGTTEVDIAVRAAGGSVVEWMPQETIVFDGARLRRRTTVETASGSRLLTGEIVVFGRIAHGETLRGGLLHDGWRVRRDGALVWADALHLADDIAGTLAAPMAFGGAVACAMLLYIADDAAERLDTARAMLAETAGDGPAAASCIGPVLIVRQLGGNAAALRRRHAALWSRIRQGCLGLPVALPRVWET